MIVGHRDIYYEKKILNSFVCVEDKILVQKCNVYEVHIFPRPLLQTCRLQTTFFCLITRLFVNNNFQIPIISIEINVKVCLLCDHHVTEGIILHIEDLTVNKCLLRCWFLCFADFLFSHFEELKCTFFTSFHFAPRGMY